MPKSYVRQSTSEITAGNRIQASSFNDEFNRLENAFATSSGNGHTHDGTAGEGGPIVKIGPNHTDVTITASAIKGTSNNAIALGTTTEGFTNLFLADDASVKFGASQDATIKYDEASSDTLLFGGANIRIANTNNKLEIRDSAISISSSTDGQLDIDADTTIEIDAPTIKFLGTAFTIGDGTAGTDLVLTFDGETSDGVITWMEDEDHFKFSDDILVNSTEKLYFNDAGGEHIAGDGDNLTISAGTDINLTATADVNIPVNVGVTFGDDGEKIEGNGTDLTINSSNDLHLTATTDINIPSNVGLTFGDDGEKIEGDGTNLTVNSSGDLNVIATTVDIDATTVEMSNDLHLNSDSAIIALGANQDVTLTHVADSGLILKNTSTGDNTPFILTLQTGEVAPEDNDTLGSIRFQAPDTSAGSDGALVTALIEAEAEATFSATANNTAIVFKTATDGAATEKIRITATGELKLGSANISEADLEQIDDLTAGTVTASKALVVDSNKDIATLRNITSNGTVQFGSLSDGAITITAFVDEDDMSSNSATLVPTQQSVKAFVDASLSSGNLNVVNDTSPQLGGNLDLNSRDITGTGNINISGNATLSGNLTVNGTTTTVSTTNTVVSDSIIELANGTSGSPSNDAGIVIERGSSNNAFIGFDESADKFTVGTGTFTGASTGDLSITTGTLVANIEGNITGNVTGDVTASVVKATNATAGTTSIQIGASDDWTVEVGNFTINSASKTDALVFKYNGTAKFAIDTDGNFTAVGDVTASGTIS